MVMLTFEEWSTLHKMSIGERRCARWAWEARQLEIDRARLELVRSLQVQLQTEPKDYVLVTVIPALIAELEAAAAGRKS